MRKTFDAELLELNEALTAMARTAQDAIDVVTESLSTDDEAHAKAAIDMTASMDQMERDIENRCLQLLLRQQPVARDLRAISAAMKMVTDLQRIGDQAANIAEISLLFSRQGEVKVPQDIGVMACKAGLMVRQAISSYTGRDVETAHAVVNLDDEVDELFRKIKGDLINQVADNLDEADLPSTLSSLQSTWRGSPTTRLISPSGRYSASQESSEKREGERSSQTVKFTDGAGTGPHRGPVPPFEPSK